MPRKERNRILFNGESIAKSLQQISDEIHNLSTSVNRQLNILQKQATRGFNAEISAQINHMLSIQEGLIEKRLNLTEHHRHLVKYKGEYLLDEDVNKRKKVLIDHTKPKDKVAPEAYEGYYVYFHVNRKTNEVFYVGKGSGNRAYSVGSRSVDWQRYALEINHEYDVVIYKSGLEEKQALQLEFEQIIENAKKYKLINKIPNKISRRFGLVNNKVITTNNPEYPVNNGRQDGKFDTCSKATNNTVLPLP